VQSDAEPTHRAPLLAAELGADLCATRGQADALLEQLRALPRLDAGSLEKLRALTARVAAARRIVDGTLDRAAFEVGERLAATGSGVAVHQSTVRDRAGAVVAARAALAAAEAQVRSEEAEFASLVVPSPLPPLPMPSEVDSFVDEPPTPRRRGFLGFFRRDRKEVEDTSESTSLLQQVVATTDQAFGARRANAAREDALMLLGVQRDRAHEDVRVAERMWHDLAGEQSVDDVESVVRRFDPQHQDAVEIAQETIGVRAVSILLRRALDEWEAFWRATGVEPPASADQAGTDQMADRLTRPVVLVADAIDVAHELAAAVPAAAVVVVQRPGAS
jgi:hypothetical protein